MNNFFSALKTTLIAKFSGVLSKIQRMTSKEYLKTTFLARLRTAFMKLFNVKPKHKKDYYSIFGWMVSKRLAYLIVILVGALSAWFIYSNRASFMGTKESDGLKSYRYSSIPLRFTSGKVKITGKSGYLAYVGEVDKGAVTGKGTLYAPDGHVIYTGDFVDNDYNGNGVLYYDNSKVRYRGTFVANYFEGSGVEYRENGSKLYDGEFVKGIKEGEGVLFDNSDSQVYEGRFSNNELVYSEFLGKTSKEAMSSYNGKRILYEGNNHFEVYMSDIGAIYEGKTDGNSINDEINVDKIYVLHNYFPTPEGNLKKIEDIKEYFRDEVLFEGLSAPMQAEALSISKVREQTMNKFFDPLEVNTEMVYDDYYTVDSFDSGTDLYLYSFKNGGLQYTFVARSKYDDFGFYYIEKEDVDANNG